MHVHIYSNTHIYIMIEKIKNKKLNKKLLKLCPIENWKIYWLEKGYYTFLCLI